MRGNYIFMSLVIVALLSVNAVSAQSSDVSLMLNKQTPYPVEPGQIVNLVVALENNGSSSQSFTLEILPAAPFTLLPGEESVKTFSNIGALSTVTETYKLKVDLSAVSTTYDLKFRYSSGSSTVYITKKIPVTVQGTPKIVIEDITTTPSVIEPGHEVELDIKLKNVGSGDATQLELVLEADADPETEESLIVPILSGGSFYLEEIGSGEEAVAMFRLDIDNNAEYKSYTSTLTITYNDESGAESTVTRDLGIPVKGSPVIKILSAKLENGDFKVDIENIGTGSAKALQIEFIQDNEVKDSSVASELKPTRSKTLRFSGFRYGEAIVKISYLDESNDVFVSENSITVKQSAASDDGSGTDYSGYVGILLLVVLIEGFYIWRMKKRMKRK